MKSVISEDMCLGNDTSHGERDDFFARNRVPSAMQSFSKKWLVNFNQLTSHFFDTQSLRLFV